MPENDASAFNSTHTLFDLVTNEAMKSLGAFYKENNVNDTRSNLLVEYRGKQANLTLPLILVQPTKIKLAYGICQTYSFPDVLNNAKVMYAKFGWIFNSIIHLSHFLIHMKFKLF